MTTIVVITIGIYAIALLVFLATKYFLKVFRKPNVSCHQLTDDQLTDDQLTDDQLTDYQLTDQKTDLLDFWFSTENLWFNCSNIEDCYIVEKFQNLFLEPVTSKDSWSDYQYLHYIILYDQITRHIDRVKNTTLKNDYGKKALEFSSYLLDTNKYIKF